MPSAATHAHTLATRCDACTQAATHRATRAGAMTVQLCDHHANASKDALKAAGFIVVGIAVPA